MLALLSSTFVRHRRPCSLAALAGVLALFAVFRLPPGATASVPLAAGDAKPHVFVPTSVPIEARDDPPIATF